jgi:CubicO group peptidase (beta-lactamase class C family)
MRRRNLVLIVLAVIAVAGVWITARPILAQAPIGSGYIASWMCSGVFVSGRMPNDLWAQEFGSETDELLARFSVTVDTEARTVRASLFGLAPAVAAYRQGLGCVLVHDGALADLRNEAIALPSMEASADLPWPEGRRVDLDDLPPGVDREKLEAALDAAFTPPETGPDPRTRAVVVVHDGRIIAERSTAPYSIHTPLYGASMSKTVTAMLIGVQVQQGRLSMEKSRLRPEWSDDPRRDITLDHLMRMSSGLRFTEVYAGTSDVNRMLFQEPDTAAFAAGQPLEAVPGTRWSYSSGTTNIVMAVARATFGGDEEAYRRFPHDALFGPLGCRSTIFQTDTSGTFVGSSYVFTSARDWARLGLLLLSDGVWRGKRLLPEGWVDYMRTPAPADPKLRYGAQTWLRGATSHDEPAPIFEMRGHGGQFVTVAPGADLVVVRLGWQNQRPGWDQRAFVNRIIEAVTGGVKRAPARW